MTLYLGCYTDAAHPNGLKELELDEATGAMSVFAEYPVANAIYQTLSPDGKYLYSCTGEGLASLRLSERAEQVDCLKLGNCVCHVAAMSDGTRVAFADYLGGFAGSVEVGNGRFGKVVKHKHSGSGPNLPRQDKAHCHQALPLPDGSGYAVCDLGLDEIVEYPSGRVFKTTPAGAGPRHLIFHPNGRLAFLVSELGNLVTSLSWSPADGFKALDSLSTLENPVNPVNPVLNTDSSRLAAAIRFTPDMKRIVVSNRGENSLVVFDFDEAIGRLAFKARTFLPGSWPRDFIFVSPTLALVAMERSGEVYALRFDAASGGFSVLSTLSDLFRPVALARR
jgi:6-phosphogluconolactonase